MYTLTLAYFMWDVHMYYIPKQEQPGCKQSGQPIRNSISCTYAYGYKQPKSLISGKAKKTL